MNNSIAALISIFIGLALTIVIGGIMGLLILGIFSMFSFGFLLLDQKDTKKEIVKDKKIFDLEKRVEALEKKINENNQTS